MSWVIHATLDQVCGLAVYQAMRGGCALLGNDGCIMWPTAPSKVWRPLAGCDHAGESADDDGHNDGGVKRNVDTDADGYAESGNGDGDMMTITMELPQLSMVTRC